MTDWYKRAKAIIDSEPNLLRQSAKDAHLDLVNERLDKEGLRNKVWGNMTYACDRCGFFEIRELEVGVEGPQHWRDDVTFIACAFTAGRCPECNNSMTHINFKGDVEYDSPREPTAKYVFRVPKEYSSYPTLGMHDDGTIIKTFADSAFLQWRAT